MPSAHVGNGEIEMSGDGDMYAWKQIKRVQQIWMELADQHDFDPDDWIYLADALDSLGYKVSKAKSQEKITNNFFGIIED